MGAGVFRSPAPARAKIVGRPPRGDFTLAAPGAGLSLSRPMSQALARIVFAVTALFFAAFFIWPVLQILQGGFIDADGRFTLAYVGALLGDPTYLGGLRNSFLLACAATTLALLIALPLAVVSDRFVFPAKGLLGSLVLIPMILPPFVGAIGIKQVFGQYGALNALLQQLGLLAPGATIDWFAQHQFWGIALVEAFSLYPIRPPRTSAAPACAAS
jgi:iron(III) transport system permease protein